MTLRLVTIGFSHYCEKARWALDLAGLPYVEESHAPVLHVPFALAAGGKRQVPVLVDTEAKRVFADSTDILHEVDARAPHLGLFPRDPALRARVVELEERFDRDLGPAVRRIAYFHVLHGGAVLGRELLTSAARRGTRAFTYAAYPLLARAIGKGLRVDRAGFERSTAKLDEVLAEVDALVLAARGEQRQWLVGDAFSAADLTFAALMSPLVLPPGLGFSFPPESLLPPDAAALTEALRARPAGQHVLRAYTEHRRRAPRDA